MSAKASCENERLFVITLWKVTILYLAILLEGDREAWGHQVSGKVVEIGPLLLANEGRPRID